MHSTKEDSMTVVTKKGLHVGRLLDVADIPLYLKGPGLKAHTLIVGQSGSGKSAMLGRLLEEIVTKTEARIVIFDPNSDFVRFSDVNEEAWTQSWAHFESEDTVDAFHKAWDPIPFDLLTARDPTGLALNPERVNVVAPTLTWESTRTLDAAAKLGFDTKTDVDEVLALDRALRRDDRLTTPEAFAKFYDRTYDQWEGSSEAEKPAAAKLYVRAAGMSLLNIWEKGSSPGSVNTHVKSLFESKLTQRVLCLDLASLEKQDERLMVTNAALGELWAAARRAWLEAIKQKKEADNRCPVFVVIDEAHNLAPVEAPLGLARAVSDTLARIATEGRKYGIFLVMVTQRPSRLDETLRTQCDNICLLKLNNRHDLQLIENSFGFVPEGWARRAMDFKQGDVLLAGALIERPVYAQAAPRRTAEGGRNLEDKAWLPHLREETTGSKN